MGLFGWGNGSGNQFMPDNEVTRQLGIDTNVIVCQSEEELTQKAQETEELLKKAGWTERMINHLCRQVDANKRIVLANLEFYKTQAEAIGDISLAVGKTMGTAGKAAGQMVKGAAKTQESVSKFQQKKNDIASRLNGGNGGSTPNTNALGGAINQPRLKAW